MVVLHNIKKKNTCYFNSAYFCYYICKGKWLINGTIKRYKFDRYKWRFVSDNGDISFHSVFTALMQENKTLTEQCAYIV
jgi:hypothetical protein